jgi:hypothetical protein
LKEAGIVIPKEGEGEESSSDEGEEGSESDSHEEDEETVFGDDEELEQAMAKTKMEVVLEEEELSEPVVVVAVEVEEDEVCASDQTRRPLDQLTSQTDV